MILYPTKEPYKGVLIGISSPLIETTIKMQNIPSNYHLFELIF